MWLGVRTWPPDHPEKDPRSDPTEEDDSFARYSMLTESFSEQQVLCRGSRQQHTKHQVLQCRVSPRVRGERSRCSCFRFRLRSATHSPIQPGREHPRVTLHLSCLFDVCPHPRDAQEHNSVLIPLAKLMERLAEAHLLWRRIMVGTILRPIWASTSVTNKLGTENCFCWH